jgi:hypothetical protein
LLAPNVADSSNAWDTVAVGVGFGVFETVSVGVHDCVGAGECEIVGLCDIVGDGDRDALELAVGEGDLEMLGDGLQAYGDRSSFRLRHPLTMQVSVSAEVKIGPFTLSRRLLFQYASSPVSLN